MSAITVGGDIVHYEVLGRGKPVVLVHGWVGSWRYWIPIMQQLHLKYRVYALDLFGFGDSAKNPEKYTMEHQVNLLAEFMNQLGLAKAALIGHGLGAQVVAEFANVHRDKVPRMLVSSAPLFDPGDLEVRGQRKLLTTNDFDVKKATEQAATEAIAQKEKEPEKDAKVSVATVNTTNGGSTTEPVVPQTSEAPATTSADATIPSGKLIDRAKLIEAAAMARAESEIAARKVAEKQADGVKTTVIDNPLFGKIGKMSSESLLIKCFKKTEPEYTRLNQDVAKQDDSVLTKMTGNFDSGRMLDILRALPMPVVVVHGADDPLIEAPSDNIWTYITTQKEDLLPVPLPGVRHFPMLEAESFTRLVNSFLEIADISKLEVKDRWRRRSR